MGDSTGETQSGGLRLRYPTESPPIWGRRAAPTGMDFSAGRRDGAEAVRWLPRGPDTEVGASPLPWFDRAAVSPGREARGSARDWGRPAERGAGTATGGRGRSAAPSTAPKGLFCVARTGGRGHVNDPSAGSPTETLLRLLLPLNDQVWTSFRQLEATKAARNASPEASLNHSIGRSDGRCVQRAGT